MRIVHMITESTFALLKKQKIEYVILTGSISA